MPRGATSTTTNGRWRKTMRNSQIEVRPIAGSIGAEILGVDVS